MEAKVNIQTSKDVIFEAIYAVAPVSNYSNGIDRGDRPAVRWAMIRLPDNVIDSGMFNLKGYSSEPTPEDAIAVARAAIFDINGNICKWVMDAVLEQYEREV